MDAPDQERQDSPKKAGLPPAVILLIAAVIVFGLMYGFIYYSNQNADWLMPRS